MTDNSQRFKKGDRVRWTGAYDMTMATPAAVGTTGTVVKDTSPRSVSTEIEWDIPPYRQRVLQLGTGIYNGNLELIAPEIDPTKPLELVTADGRASAVPFITETSEGHILVGRRSDPLAHGTWHIFTKTGEWMRSDGDPNWAGVPTLRNKPVATTEYAAVTPRGEIRSGYLNRDLAADKNPDAPFLIRVHKTDGVVTNVDAVKR